MEIKMNKEQAQGKFDQLKGRIKQTWGKLTDDDIMLYEGKREQFLGKIKDHYGLAKEDAEEKIKTLEQTI
jgi:uncharacterized protein YjbJ (UPF0337 family)